MVNNDRVGRLRERFNATAGSCLISDPLNIEYYTGVECSDSFLLVTARQLYLITDLRFMVEAQALRPYAVPILRRRGKVNSLIKVIKSKKCFPLCLDRQMTPLNLYLKCVEEFSLKRIVTADTFLAEIRMIKDESELAIMKEAVVIAEKALCRTRSFLQKETTEQKVAAQIEAYMLLSGARSHAFPTIVASGGNSAKPHAVPTGAKMRRRTSVLIDLGATVSGYRSDLTRLVTFPTIDKKLARLYTLVKDAQWSAVQSIRPGVPARTIDRIARSYLGRYGYREQFTHALGHGVGKQVHELPMISSASEAVLQPGMVVTIEPGVYIKGIGGVRREDMVVVTPNGYRFLSDFEREP